MNPTVERTCGPYRVLELLGRGGMASVYRAEDARSGELVALKTVEATSEREVRSIRREVRALARLRHPGIARILGDGVDRGRPWYAMELVDGRTLGQLCQGDGATRSLEGPDRWWTRSLAPDDTLSDADDAASPLPVERVVVLAFDRALALARALCESLAYLHGEGIVHRDLKPDNVLLRAGEDPVIVDFGLASAAGAAPSREALEVRAELAGTAAYMAPELIRGESVDARADLYALGCMLYEMTTGVRPFAAFTTAAVLQGHLELTPAPPSSLVPTLPRAFDELVLQLLAKQPADRIGHALDVARALEELGAARPARSGPRAQDYLYRASLVGRDGPMASLLASLEGTRNGRLVLIGGEAGIGKTRLANELGAQAGARRFAVLEGECQRVGGALHAFQSPLRAILDRARALGPAEVARVFEGRAPILAELAPFLHALGPFPPAPPLDASAGRVRAMRALADCIASAAAPRTVLLLDDLHWADTLTLDALGYLAREVLPSAPLWIVGTYRREETSDALVALAAHATTLSLDRLQPVEVAALVRGMLANDAPPEVLVELAHRSVGNPFFVAEYLRAALDAGTLRRDPRGRWALVAEDRVLALPAPATVRELVQRRLEGLSREARVLLAAAAIKGDDLDVASLLRIAGLDEDATFAGLDELVARGVLEGSDPLRFVHDLLRSAALDALDEGARRDWHRRVAEALPPEALETRAHHWRAAGVRARAIEASDAAGEAAIMQWSYARAEAHFRALLELAPEDPRATRWEQQLAEARIGLGDPRGGQRHLLRVLARSGLPSADSAAGLVRRLVSESARQLAHRVAAPRPKADDATLRLARAHQRLVEFYWFDNDVVRMLDAGLHALNLAENAGPSPELVRAYATMALAAGGLPLHRVAERYGRLAMQTAATVDDPAAEAYARFILSVYRVGKGDWSRVTFDLERVTAICERIGDPRFLGEAWTVLGMTALYRGDHALAEERFQPAAELGRRFDNAQHRLWAALGLAEARLRLGDLDGAASRLADAGRAIDADRVQALERLRYHGLQATLALARGTLDRARASAERAEVEAEALLAPTAHYLLEGYAGIAETRLAIAARDPSSLRQARAAVAAMGRYAFFFRIGAPRAAKVAGDLAWIEGRRARARRRWKEAAVRAAALGMRWEREHAERVPSGS